jgi:hypothetical protein
MTLILNGTDNSATVPAVQGGAAGTSTGLYYPTTNSVGISTAGTNAVYIDASQNVGIGTSSPASKLNVLGNVNNSANSLGTLDSATLTVQNLSSAALQITSKLNLGVTSNGVTYGYSSIASAYTNYNGAGDIGTGLLFGTQTNAAGGTTERMRIDSSGRVLINANSTTSYFDGQLNVAGTSTVKAISGSAQVPLFAWNNATTGDNNLILFLTETTATLRGSITYYRAGGVTVYGTTSDYRAKTVNGPVVNALSKLSLLKPSTGRMNGATQDIDFFVAHELQEVVPSAVSGEKDAVNEDNTPKYQTVDSSALIPLLTAAIKEQQALITTLTARIEALEAK